MGSSTGWELSKSGQKMLLIEKQDSKYETGSSFGEARFSHSSGQKNHVFSYLHQVSINKTKELISYLNEIEKGAIHKMEEVYQTSPLTYIYYSSQLDAVNQLLKNQRDKFEFAPNKEKASQLFDMRIPDAAMVIRKHQKYFGALNPRVLISKLHQGIFQSGNKVVYNREVISLKRVGKVYEIQIKPVSYTHLTLPTIYTV